VERTWIALRLCLFASASNLFFPFSFFYTQSRIYPQIDAFLVDVVLLPFFCFHFLACPILKYQISHMSHGLLLTRSILQCTYLILRSELLRFCLLRGYAAAAGSETFAMIIASLHQNCYWWWLENSIFSIYGK
jgi:hypothetical protein